MSHISLAIITLRAYLAPLMALSSRDFISSPLRGSFLLLLRVLVAIFSIKGLIGFYVLFELSVLPLRLCVLG